MAPSEELSIDIAGLRAHVFVDRLSQGLAGGGLRFSPSVTLAELRRLARTMTYKWALLDLPFGGCKLGIKGDPAISDKAAIMARFARKAGDFLRDRIFTGPDMGTSPADMKSLFTELGQDSYDVVSARLQTLGYTPTPKEGYRRILRSIQYDVTGLAVAHATKAVWEMLEGSFAGATVSLQGFGSVGKAAAEEFDRLGAIVVCIADAEGSLWDPDGLDIGTLVGPQDGIMNRRQLTGGAVARRRDEWVGVEADILVPAAVSDAINWDNVGRVRGRMVAEAANIPVPHDVEFHLYKSGVLVLPDFVVNGGLAGAFGALLTGGWGSAEDVLKEVIGRIVAATSEVVEEVMSEHRSPRDIAEKIAQSRFDS